MKNIRPDFTKKLVSLSLVGDEGTRILDCPHWEMQAGRLFLVGIVPRGGSGGDWCEGIQCAAAWDQVTDYLVFDSAKHYRKQLAIYEKRKRKA
jgi:hypothetical protein